MVNITCESVEVVIENEGTTENRPIMFIAYIHFMAQMILVQLLRKEIGNELFDTTALWNTIL